MSLSKIIAPIAFTAAVAYASFAQTTVERPLELRVQSKAKDSVYSLVYVAPDGKSSIVKSSKDSKAVRDFFARFAGSSKEQSSIRLIVPDGTTLETVFAAVKEIEGFGFRQVQYFGCVPPGCSILTGATPDQLRCSGKLFETGALMKIIAENSEKC